MNSVEVKSIIAPVLTSNITFNLEDNLEDNLNYIETFFLSTCVYKSDEGRDVCMKYENILSKDSILDILNYIKKVRTIKKIHSIYIYSRYPDFEYISRKSYEQLHKFYNFIQNDKENLISKILTDVSKLVYLLLVDTENLKN